MFKFQWDSTSDCRVSCPGASEKLTYELVSNLGPSFLIGSFSFLQVTRTTIKARVSLNFNQIGLLIAELAALESVWKNPYRLTMGEML